VTLGSNTDQQSDLVRSFAQLQQSMEGKERVLQQKNAEISRLNVDLSHARTQHDHVIRDFEDYKVRAQTLLRQKDNVTETAQRQRELEELVLRVTELDGELETSRRKLVEAEEDLRKEKWESEAAKRAFDAEKIRWEKALLEGEFKSRSLETSQV
jgi:chromosome segregation ATPase